MNLGDFRALFLGWLNRSDCTTDLATTFINRGIGRMQRECRLPLMEREYLPTADGSDGSWQTVAIPNDFIAMKDILADGISEVNNVSLAKYLTAPAYVGCPRYYTRRQGNWLFRPYPSSSLSIVYYGQFDALVNDSDTNMLITAAPEVLLWAALAYAADYFKMDDKDAWNQQYTGERDALILQGLDADFGDPQGVEPVSGVECYL